MHELHNEHLTVQVLDPVADRDRLGVRYCSGGYIWQVLDHEVGPLVTGPEGPSPHPSPFNGHGLPESFRDRSREGHPFTWIADRGLAPGLGTLARRGDEIVLQEPCTWSVTRSEDRLMFHTQQRLGELHCAVFRMIQLADRDVLSVTRFSNLGRHLLNLQWFAHPFFPLDTTGRISARVHPASRLPENPAFQLADGCLTLGRSFTGQHEGHFELLDLPVSQPFRVQLEHPRVRGVELTASFAPSECPLWANGHTFSIEPYQRLVLECTQTRHWTLRYRFGSPSSTGAGSSSGTRSP